MTKVERKADGTWAAWFKGFLIGEYLVEEQAYTALLDYAYDVQREQEEDR